MACNDVNSVMIVVELIENHPPSDDEYRPDGSRSQVPRPAQCGSCAEALGPQFLDHLSCNEPFHLVSVGSSKRAPCAPGLDQQNQVSLQRRGVICQDDCRTALRWVSVTNW